MTTRAKHSIAAADADDRADDDDSAGDDDDSAKK